MPTNTREGYLIKSVGSALKQRRRGGPVGEIARVMHLGFATVWRYARGINPPGWLVFALLGAIQSGGDPARADALLEAELQRRERRRERARKQREG